MVKFNIRGKNISFRGKKFKVVSRFENKKNNDYGKYIYELEDTSGNTNYVGSKYLINAKAKGLLKILKKKEKMTSVEMVIKYNTVTYKNGDKQINPPQEYRENKRIKGELTEDKKIRIALEIIEMLSALYDSNVKYYETLDIIASILDNDNLNDGAVDRNEQPMYKAKPIQYMFIPANINEPKEDGKCVDEYIINTYKKQIPTLTEEKLNEIISHKVYGVKETEKANYKIFSGRNVIEIDAFCSHYKISHYAIDVTNKVFHKTVFNNSNYPALMYYMIDEHMYPVEDKKIRQHIVKVNQSHTSNSISSLLLDNKEDKEQDTIDRFKLDFFEDIDVKELDNYKDCNIFYHTGNLHSMFLDLFRIKNKQYKVITNGDTIGCIKYDNNVYLFSNCNHKHNKDWNDSIKLCQTLNIPFKNQSIHMLGYEMFQQNNIKGNKVACRKQISKTIKEKILNNQNQLCNNCECSLLIKKDDITKLKYEIDHIIPISCGGDNNIENLQALCKECHTEKTNRESAERVFNIDNITSSYNQQTKPIFSAKKNAFIHIFQQYRKNKENIIFGLDINKCRKNILRYSKYSYCVYSCLDDVKPINNEIKHDNSVSIGYYYIETSNFFPLKGNGWYSYVMVEFCLKNNIINKEDIKYCVIPSLTIKHDYFNKFIDSVYENAPEQYSKLMVNGVIGMFGHKVNKKRTIYIFNSINEASNHFFNNKKTHVVKHDDFYEVIIKDEKYIEDSLTPIFNQVLDLEAIELYNLSKILTDNNGILLCVNTDNATAKFTNKKDVLNVKKAIKTMFWDKNSKILKYKKERKILVEDRKEVARTTNYELPTINYNVINDVEDNDFTEKINDLINLNEGFQIDGRAGCGKTYFIKELIKKLDEQKKKYIILAPTHKACRQLTENAMTLHSFISKYNIKNNAQYKKINSYDYIIIDEKSMIKELFFRILYNIKQNTKCKIILSGDWNQLEPVADRTDFDYENSSLIHYICDGNMFQLTKCRRADDTLFNLCKNVNNIDVRRFNKTIWKRSLVYRNSKRKEINELWMNKLLPKRYIEIPKNPIDKNSQDMKIFKGMPIIACKTSTEYDICNGEEFRVKDCCKSHITLKQDERIIKINTDVFNKLFYPAYAITVHKSQGVTFYESYTIFEWDDYSDRMKYVALSRATDVENINFCFA